jgi:hypothetical protein
MVIINAAAGVMVAAGCEIAGACASGKTCNSIGQCIVSGGGGTIVGKLIVKLTRTEILVKIAEIKQLIIKLIIQLIIDLQKRLLAM